MTRRPSAQSVAVLLAFAAEPTAWRYGYELGPEVGLKAGSLYPILMRLSDRGQLEARWHTDVPGRPPRHLYRLSEQGRRVAAELSAAGLRTTKSRPTKVTTTAGLGAADGPVACGRANLLAVRPEGLAPFRPRGATGPSC